MPYKVISFKKNREIGSKAWRTKTAAVAHAKEPQFGVTSAIVVDAGTNEIVLAMTKAMGPTNPGEGGGIMLSQIVIETEASGNPQTTLRLSVDKQVVAENL